MLIRQGDILFRPVNRAGGKLVKHDGSFIVALGERTGHHHKLVGGKFTIKEVEGEITRRYLIVELATTLTHQEHNAVIIGPGTYIIDHEREFDYELREIRNVQD